MHSRIFVIATMEEIINGDYEVPTPEEVVDSIRLADYSTVIGKPENGKAEDIQWFKDVYGENTVLQKTVLENEFEEKIVGYKIDKEALLRALETSFDDTIEAIRKALDIIPKDGQKKTFLIDKIHYITASGGFYFFMKDLGFLGETDLYNVINSLKDEKLFIIATLDYHM